MRPSTSLAGALAGLASLSTLARASPIALAARNTNGAGSPSVSIKNGTVEGLSLPTFSQEGASPPPPLSLPRALPDCPTDSPSLPRSVPRHPLRPAAGG